MPIQLNEEDGGKILLVHVSGKLVKTDYEHFVPEFERLVGLHGKLRVLFDMTGLHGWTAGALWEDTKFATHHRSLRRIISATLSVWRWSEKKSGRKGWQPFANRSRKRRSNTSITPMPLSRGSGWPSHKPMNESKPDHKSHGDPNGGPINQGHPPYWRRAHRDWRIWFCMIVMLFAMLVYVATGGFRWRIHGQPQQPMQPISAPAGN